MGMGKKKKLSKYQKEKRSKVAEKLKSKKGIKEPFALATSIAKGTVRRRKKKR